MDCKDIREQLSALIDNELTDTEKEAVLSHIAECESCKKEYEELQAIKKEFAKLDFQLRGALADSVMQKIREEPKSKKKTPFFVRYMGTAAALLIIVVVLVYIRLNPANEALDAVGKTKDPADRNSTVTESESFDDTIETKPSYQFAIGEGTKDSFTKVEDILIEESKSEEVQSNGIKNETAPDSPKSEAMLKDSPAESDTAVIYVNSDVETITPLFDSVESIGSNCVNVSAHPDEVIAILYSNSITITHLEIPDDTDKTSIYTE